MARRRAAVVRCLMAWILLIPAQMAHASNQQVAETVKATFLVRFAAFVTWPPQAFASSSSPFVLCVAGRDPFGAALRDAALNQRAAGRTILVRAVTTPAQLQACHLVYVGSGGTTLANTLDPRSPVLLVTDAEVTSRPGMIHFAIMSGRVRFHIDAGATQRAGLRVSSRLLALAVTVEGMT